VAHYARRKDTALQSTTRLPRTPMSDESAFIALSERVLEAIASALDAAEADVEWTLNDGVLTLDCASAGKLIINRHLPSRELWVAAKSGGFHFRRETGAWRDTRDGTELGAALERLLREQAGITIAVPALPAV
jgi:CyaY protein